METYHKFVSALSGEGFSERNGQRILSWNLLDLVKRPAGTSYALQAPTGTGKSIAALLAGVESAQNDLGRVCIGTSTVILSEQYNDDIALVQRVFPKVKIFVLKGASHYVCWNRVDEHMKKVERWEDTYNECKQQIIDFNMGRTERIPSWAQASSEDCVDCRMEKQGETAEAARKRLENCTFSMARSEARRADVVVTSHAMISVHLSLVGKKVEGGILGEISTFIFDEAHKLSSLLYTESVSPWDMNKLMKYNIIRPMNSIKQRKLVDHFEDIRFQAFPEKNKTGRAGTKISDSIDSAEAARLLSFFPDATEVKSMLSLISSTTFSHDEKEDNKIHREVLGAVNAFAIASRVLGEMAEGRMDGDMALWRSVSRFGGGEESLGYNIRSMEASPWLLRALEDYRVGWMSATLGIDGNEDYVLSSFGIKNTELYEIDSPFDFASQMDVMVVDEKSFNRFSDDSFINTIHWLNTVVPGGTLVLTDSHKTSEWVARDMSSRGFLAHAQDKSSARANSSYVAAHCQNAAEGGSPVLSGVDVFSTGLNLKREACTAVFVHTIKPIRAPRPYIAWRRRWLESQGIDSFKAFILPEQAIVLEQQIGRLIRTEQDCGVVLVSCKMDDAEQVEILRAALARFPGAQMVTGENAGVRFRVGVNL